MYKNARSFSEAKMQPDTVRASIEQKVHQLLKSQQKRIDEFKFVDKYPKEEIQSNITEISELEAKFNSNDTLERKNLTQLSEIFEMLLPELAELYNWMGENVFIVKTSRYDDIKNGVDLVAEIVEDEKFQYLGLAIDVALSGYNIENKVARIASRIKDGHLANVKFFDSENSDYHDELRDIAKVVITTDRKTLDELAETKLILNNLEQRRNKPLSIEDSKNLSKQIKEIKEKLRTHPLQIFILEQIKIQLERFAQYATQVNQLEISGKYRKLLTLINKIYLDKMNDKELMTLINLNPTQNSNTLVDIEESLDKILGPDSREMDF